MPNTEEKNLESKTHEHHGHGRCANCHGHHLTGKVILGIVGLFIFFLIFCGGVFVGVEKARFSYRRGDADFRPGIGMMGRGQRNLAWDQNSANAHGNTGVISQINGNNLTVTTGNNQTQTVIINDQTVIAAGPNQTLKITDLKINDRVVIIGAPDQNSQIIASLIRVMPIGPGMMLPPLK